MLVFASTVERPGGIHKPTKPGAGLTAVFLAFHIAGGIVGLPIVVLSILLSRQISRHPTLLNFCATWTLASVVYTLLLYAGQEGNDHPSFNLCVAQAAMVNGAFPMTSTAAVALAAHIWHGLGPSRPWSQFGLASRNIQTARLVALILAPYLVFLAFSIPGAIVGHANPARLKSSDAVFYCTLDSGAFNVIVSTFVAVAMGMILVLEGAILLFILKNAYIRAGIKHSGSFLFLLRLAGFTVYAIIAIIVASLFLANDHEFAPYVIQATLPVAVFIFIGTQKEVVTLWKRWLRPFRSNNSIQGGLHQRSKSTTALLQHNVTSSFAAQETLQLQNSALDDIEGFNIDVFKAVAPMTSEIPRRPERPPHTGLTRFESFFNEPPRPDLVHADHSRNGYSDLGHHRVGNADDLQQEISGADGLDQDPGMVVATQKQTISRLLEETEHMKRALDKLKDVERTLHKTQNLLVTEKRSATQLRNYANQMEQDLQSQTNVINNLLVTSKELEDKHKMQEEELGRLRRGNAMLSDALQLSVKNELDLKDKYDRLKVENSTLAEDMKNITSERDILLDIWSTLESPIDWEMRKPDGPSRRSVQHTFPELAQKMRQRASTPSPRTGSKIASKILRRRTEGRPGVAADTLDRLRPRMLKLSGKMELSEKVSGLEELVREQTALIEELESAVDEERRERMRLQLEGNMENWSIPNSISSSMIAEKDSASRKTVSVTGAQ